MITTSLLNIVSVFFRWGRSDLAVVELAHELGEDVFYKLGAPLRPIALAEQPPSMKPTRSSWFGDDLIVLDPLHF